MKSIDIDFQHNKHIINTKSGAEGNLQFTWNVGFNLVGAINQFQFFLKIQ